MKIDSLLENLGPTLSTDLTQHLVKNYGLKNNTARQRISRSGPNVKRLAHLPFPRNARFLYLQKDYATSRYWKSLFKAIYETKGAYARALGAVEARKILPIEHFEIACGAPKAQKKHLSAKTVLERLLSANVLVKEFVPGIGLSVMTKKTFDSLLGGDSSFPAQAKARLIAESILLDGIKEWLRRLAFASYNSVKVRMKNEPAAPMAGTFAWDITAPSYITGLTTWNKDKKKPGLILCDVLLNNLVKPHHIEPFLYKVETLQALKNVGRGIYIFVAQRFDKESFNMLRTAGIIPATPETLFGKEIADAFRDLVGVLTNAAMGALDPERFDELFSKLSKLEGAFGNMRGAFFELLVAEVVRKKSPAQVEVNKICKGEDGEAEVDVWEFKEGIVARMIECKGLSSGSMVSDQEIDLWLTRRIKRIRDHLESLNWKGPNPKFELWTSGSLSTEALARIERTKKTNINKFDLAVLGPEEIRREVRSVNDNALLKIFEHHFIPNISAV